MLARTVKVNYPVGFTINYLHDPFMAASGTTRAVPGQLCFIHAGILSTYLLPHARSQRKLAE